MNLNDCRLNHVIGLYRISGRVLTVLAMLLVGIAFLVWLDGKSMSRSGGETWVLNDPGSYSQVQRGIQQYVSPDLWDGVFVPFLELPTWLGTGLIVLFLLVTGSLLMFLGRKKEPKEKLVSTTGGG